MATIDDIATELNENNKSLTNKIKLHMFDVIAVGLVVAVGLLNLGAIEMRNIGEEIVNILLEAVPFYLGSVALALNFYKKGVYGAKACETFTNTVKHYSSKVNILTGKQIDKLNDFCFDYNCKALRIRQESILRDVAISFDRFDKVTLDEEGHKLKPLKISTESELKATYGETVAAAIIKAKNVKIKGLSPNNLLGNLNTDDITDLGKNEQEMLKDRSKEYSIVYMASILVMSMMGVKDILEWGWMGAFLLAFKMLYILCRSYMKYFEGFDDINIRLVNHISRKTDVLKEFDYWYDSKYPNEIILPKSDSNSNNNKNSSYNNNERLQNGLRPNLAQKR